MTASFLPAVRPDEFSPAVNDPKMNCDQDSSLVPVESPALGGIFACALYSKLQPEFCPALGEASNQTRNLQHHQIHPKIIPTQHTAEP